MELNEGKRKIREIKRTRGEGKKKTMNGEKSR